MSSVQPVFLKNRDIPNSEQNRVTGLELCLAAERSAGQGTVAGAQDIRGLWRIYPTTRQARNELLVKGMTVRNSVLQLSNTNPFILREESGEEKPATKVWVADIPMSVANSEIEHSLVKIGCELRSSIKQERYRDADNKLTRFETGRRFVFITIPSIPLEKSLKVGPFLARVYHKEQKSVLKSVICSKCLQPNHHASVCVNEVVCKTCKQPGHMRGDPNCVMTSDNAQIKHNPVHQTENIVRPSQKSQNEYTRERISKDPPGIKATVTRDNIGGRGKGETGVSNNKNKKSGGGDHGKTERGRTEKKQTTLHSSMATRLDHQRRRSETPKRRRSGDLDSPTASLEKQARCEDSEGEYDEGGKPDADIPGIWE